ncbi:hypothetical protein M758_4G131200 [Ceratodon purpureus]|uniref:DUF7748 domain-containing protein n=1 Tax=Ceratodon purpureus TaxID=3225 RepID=A0A8T0IAD3_CERPU|nr:hypothetical protein KC19_4G129700 [Ceratodon purpureus]KAG0619322.1 hypothetical protein M758_4G131200 [Ceratodon purpureus]
MEEKLTTMIVNETGHDLVMKVGNRNCFVPLAIVKKRCQHAMELCMNWTYQEFLLETKNLNDVVGKKLFVNSDDCCDYERITVKESDGKFVVDRVPRKQFNAEEQTAARQGILSWLKSWLWY